MEVPLIRVTTFDQLRVGFISATEEAPDIPYAVMTGLANQSKAFEKCKKFGTRTSSASERQDIIEVNKQAQLLKEQQKTAALNSRPPKAKGVQPTTKATAKPSVYEISKGAEMKPSRGNVKKPPDDNESAPSKRQRRLSSPRVLQSVFETPVPEKLKKSRSRNAANQFAGNSGSGETSTSLSTFTTSSTTTPLEVLNLTVDDCRIGEAIALMKKQRRDDEVATIRAEAMSQVIIIHLIIFIVIIITMHIYSCIFDFLFLAITFAFFSSIFLSLYCTD